LLLCPTGLPVGADVLLLSVLLLSLLPIIVLPPTTLLLLVLLAPLALLLVLAVAMIEGTGSHAGAFSIRRWRMVAQKEAVRATCIMALPHCSRRGPLINGYMAVLMD
jgi:hypothetical protein